MGTPQGTILNWGRDLVEFGGVPSHNSVDDPLITSIPPESEWRTNLGSTIPATVVKNCPGDPELFALSHGGSPQVLNYPQTPPLLFTSCLMPSKNFFRIEKNPQKKRKKFLFLYSATIGKNFPVKH
ncbi:ATV_HP_G0007450.mRNA.1.CDS.1 [Saccharomyces cerevisiae]|nr:ATV_HP_G0007450.mRNA.1.CDS.1 [Saccharomyces cerevisiae]CAI6940654.1 ATV_HP_G0007450.mRNA.1.CDS.1 [Saccharomyces cerevisiae]